LTGHDCQDCGPRLQTIVSRRKLRESHATLPAYGDESWFEWAGAHVRNKTATYRMPIKHAFEIEHAAERQRKKRDGLTHGEETEIMSRLIGKNATMKLLRQGLGSATRANNRTRVKYRRHLAASLRKDAAARSRHRALSNGASSSSSSSADGCKGIEIVGDVCYLKDSTVVTTDMSASSSLVFTRFDLNPSTPPSPPVFTRFDLNPAAPPPSRPPTAPTELHGLQQSGMPSCRTQATEAECRVYHATVDEEVGPAIPFEVIDDGSKPRGCLLVASGVLSVVFNSAAAVEVSCSESVSCVCLQTYDDQDQDLPPSGRIAVTCKHATNMYCVDTPSGDSYGDGISPTSDGYCDDFLLLLFFDCTDCGARCLSHVGGFATDETDCTCYGAQEDEVRNELTWTSSPPPPRPPSAPPRPENPPFAPLAVDQYIDRHTVELQVALTSQVTTYMDQVGLDAIVALVATAAGVDAASFTTSFTTAGTTATIASAAAFAMAAAITSPPSPPLLLANGCPADGSLDVCDLWPNTIDTELMDATKYNYLYDDTAGTYARMGSGSAFFSPTQFVKNGLCTQCTNRTY